MPPDQHREAHCHRGRAALRPRPRGIDRAPVKELKAFDRITLEPGQSRTVEFELPAEDLAFWGLDMQKRVEPGTFDL